MAETLTRIAMWSGPRNISTAMMRSFENRADTVVVDEPFYACYLDQTGFDHPGRDVILAAQSANPAEVQADLLAPLPQGKRVFYQKHMCHHLVDGVDGAWMDAVSHVFLIRDPRKMIASYVKQRPAVTLRDLGIPQQLDLFNRTADSLGAPPPVLDSVDVLTDPKGSLTRLCGVLGIDFDPAMLSWPAGKRDSDGVWAPWWYENVEKSTAFAPYKPEPTALSPALEKIADEAIDYYNQMITYKL